MSSASWCDHSASTRLSSELNKVLLPLISWLLLFSLEVVRDQSPRREKHEDSIILTQTRMPRYQLTGCGESVYTVWLVVLLSAKCCDRAKSEEKESKRMN